MKTFKEYIEESYNFRLGGSQKKGFDQNSQTEYKTFNELEDGDKFYAWWGVNDFPIVYEYTFKASYDYTAEELKIDNSAREIITMPKQDADSTVSYEQGHYKHCISTNIPDMQKVLKNEFNVDIEEIKVK